jgi:hypothetical protein
MRYTHTVGCSLSILVNSILGGEYNQTFSARNWEWKRANRYNLVFVIDIIHYKEPDHCMMSYIRWLYIQQGLHKINDMHSRLKDFQHNYTIRG